MTNITGGTALMHASENGHLEIVRELCRKGANVNAARADNGFTALMLASWNGHQEVVRELCERGGRK
jgi:ankyrin repeat protein